MSVKYNDYPLEKIIQEANIRIKQGWIVHQKWTCKHCDSRQTMGQENTFYQSGRCEECNQVTIIKACNFMLISSNAPKPK